MHKLVLSNQQQQVIEMYSIDESSKVTVREVYPGELEHLAERLDAMSRRLEDKNRQLELASYLLDCQRRVCNSVTSKLNELDVSLINFVFFWMCKS